MCLCRNKGKNVVKAKKLVVWKTTQQRLDQLAGKCKFTGRQFAPGLLARRALRKPMAA